MKKIVLALLVVVSFSSFAAEKPTVEEVYDGWDLDKIYVFTDTSRGKWCYIVRDSGRVGMQCFDIEMNKNK